MELNLIFKADAPKETSEDFVKDHIGRICYCLMEFEKAHPKIMQGEPNKVRRADMTMLDFAQKSMTNSPIPGIFVLNDAIAIAFPVLVHNQPEAVKLKEFFEDLLVQHGLRRGENWSAGKATLVKQLSTEKHSREANVLPDIDPDLKNLIKQMQAGNDAEVSAIIDEKSDLLSKFDLSNYTPALWAIYYANPKYLRMIADRAPETLSIPNKLGERPVHFAIRVMKLFGRDMTECLKIIADVAPETLSIKNDEGQTPAFLVVWADDKDKAECIKIIADAAPETLSVTNDKGVMPAHFAAGWNRFKCLKVIADAAPQTLFTSDSEGETAEDIAQKNTYIECIKIINAKKITSDKTSTDYVEPTDYKEELPKNKWWQFWK